MTIRFPPRIESIGFSNPICCDICSNPYDELIRITYLTPRQNTKCIYMCNNCICKINKAINVKYANSARELDLE